MDNHNRVSRRKKPFLIGVAGGVSSGKSSVCRKIIEHLAELNQDHKKQILIISFDSFYKTLSPDEQLKVQRGEHNFDHPSAFDDDYAYQVITDLINGKEVKIQLYENKTYNFKNDECINIKPDDHSPDVVIIEGILVFYFQRIRDLFQMKLFVDCDADTRLARRVLRDMGEYSRDLESVLTYYTKFVKPAFEEFCLPTKKYADVIIPRGAENNVAINLIVQHIDDLLNHSLQHSFNNNNFTPLQVNSNNSVSNHNHDSHTTPTKSSNKRAKANTSSSTSNITSNSLNTSNSAHSLTPRVTAAAANNTNLLNGNDSTSYNQQSRSAEQSPISKRNEMSQRPH